MSGRQDKSASVKMLILSYMLVKTYVLGVLLSNHNIHVCFG